MKRVPDELISKTKNMIYKISIQFKGLADIEDLFQAGVIGLIKAYNNYDNNLNSEFTSYAYKYIYGEILLFVKNNRNIKVGDSYMKIYKLYEKSKDILTTKLGRVPSVIEISNFMNIDLNTLNEALSSCLFTVSMDSKLNDEDFSLEDVIGIDNSNLVDDRIDIRNEIDKLPSEDKKLIVLRYYKNYTQSETAKMMNISQVKVSRKESKILKKIKERITV